MWSRMFAVGWLIGARDEFEEEEKVLLHAHLLRSNPSEIIVSKSTSKYLEVPVNSSKLVLVSTSSTGND